MRRRRLPGPLAVALAMGLGALLLPSALSVWMDPKGRTYLTDGEEPPVEGAVPVTRDQVEHEWRGHAFGEPLQGRSETSSAEDRYQRALRAATDDLARGEVRRGIQQLRHLQAAHPERPAAGLRLAKAERARGRLESARAALESLLGLASAGSERELGEASALLREIDEDLALQRSGGGAVEELATPNFRVVYDHAFAGRDYGARVAELLEDVRARVAGSLGRALARPLDVHLYTRARYLEAYEHKFGFATVGFYDGAIHVVSARHPRAELLALLVHEYAHAVFREALGGDQPFFLNEGIADREEEKVRGRQALAREEWRRLLDAQREAAWIPLASLVEGFGGVRGERALQAYLESRGAVELVERARPGAIARWLDRCARGEPWESALRAEAGSDVAGLDGILGREIRDRFAADPLGS